MSRTVNALCIDLEHWYCSEFLTSYLPEKRQDQIIESLVPLLNLLDKYRVKATFAVLGTVAELHPEVVKEIFLKDHEVACHGYSHKMLHHLGKDRFEEEIKKSVELLQSITGEKPIGFRAPSFSLNNSTRWALEILIKNGFHWDASIFPIKTMLYGVPNAPLHIYKPSLADLTKNDPDGALIEFPMTVFRIMGVNVPVAGGFYLRVLPFWFLKFAIKRVIKERPAIVYIHPWETYSKTPRLRDIPVFSRFVTYYGINSALDKFERLLRTFEFTSVREVLELEKSDNRVV